MEYAKITKEMIDNTSFSKALSGNPTDKNSLIGDYVSSNGELFFKTDHGLKKHHFVVPEWRDLENTPEGIKTAFLLAQASHLTLPGQERAATRTAVWIEDGHVFWSGQWTGQPPEGEVMTTGQVMSTWWNRRDSRFANQESPEGLFTVGSDPENDQGHGWYPHTQIRELSPGVWVSEVIELSDHF